VKALVACSLALGLTLSAGPAAVAQDTPFTARVLTEVCLPYANRQLSFEKAIRAARELHFRRPQNDRAPLDEWASEINLISDDGVWRLRLEENTIDLDAERQAYAVTCSMSSSRASARELADFGRRAFRNERYWVIPEGDARAWDRRSPSPEEYQLQVRVTEGESQRPVLSIQGLYF
jgi:hypothetical protein